MVTNILSAQKIGFTKINKQWCPFRLNDIFYTLILGVFKCFGGFAYGCSVYCKGTQSFFKVYIEITFDATINLFKSGLLNVPLRYYYF